MSDSGQILHCICSSCGRVVIVMVGVVTLVRPATHRAGDCRTDGYRTF